MLVCRPCGRFYRILKNGVPVEETMPRGDGWAPYKLWVGDLYKCEGCGAEVIAGFAREPVAEHYMESYAVHRERWRQIGGVQRYGLTVVNDCPGQYSEARAARIQQ